MAATRVELANAYINIVPSTRDIAPAIKDALGDVDKAVAKSGASMGDKITSAMGKTMKVGAAATGAAVGGVLAGSIAKGMGRLTSIDRSTQMLKGLGNEAKDVAKIMDNALASVEGTAFGMGEAATVASQMVASGIKPGKELTQVLKTVGDVASITGDSMEDMGMIFGSVKARGKLMGDDLMQLRARGLPVLDILGESLGKTAEEVAAMSKEGEISFEIFETAMREKMGGAALAMGDTFQGAVANVGAAMGRLGETILTPIFEASPKILQATRQVFNDMNTAIKPAMEEVGKSLTPALEQAANVVQEKVSPVLAEGAGEVAKFLAEMTQKGIDSGLWERLGNSFKSLGDTLKQMWPDLQKLGESFAVIIANVSVATWEALVNVFNALAPLITSVLVPLIEQVAKFAENNPKAVQAIVMGFLGFKAVGAIAGPVKTATSSITSLSEATKFFTKSFKGGKGIAGGLVNIMSNGFKHANPLIAAASSGIGKFIQILSKMTVVIRPIFNVLKMVITKINPWVAIITTAAAALTWFFTKTETGQKVWSAAIEKVGQGLDWLREKLAQAGQWFAGVWDSVVETAKRAGEAIKGVFEWIVEAGKWLVNVIGTVVIGAFIIAWNLLAAAIKGTWEYIILPVWHAIAAVATWLWQNVLVPAFDGIKWAFQAVGDGIKWVWENIIKTTWDAIAAGAIWLWENALLPAFNAIKTGFENVGNGFVWVWENIIKPLWDGMGEMARLLWENALKPVFDAIVAGWNALGTAMQWVWDSIIKPVWDLLVLTAQNAWNGVLFIFDAIVAGWNALGNGLRWIYDSIIQPVWDSFANALRWLYDSVVIPVTNWIQEKWQQLGHGLASVKDWIVDSVFGGLQRGLDTLKGWFQSAVNGITTIWGKIKAATAKPAKFVVETVYNNGIRKAWNLVSKFTGLQELEPARVGDLGAYARGGVLPGYTPGRDPYTFIEPRTGMRIGLSGGEAIMRPEWARMVGAKNVTKMNALAARGKLTPEMVNTVQSPMPATYRELTFGSDIPNPEAGHRVNKKHLADAMRRDVNARVSHKFASGGLYTPTRREEQQLAGGVVNRSLWVAAKTAFPGATLNSAKSDHGNDGGYHPMGQAVDLGGPMQQIADWIFSKWPKTAQLIWGPGPLALWGKTGHIDPSNQAGIRAAYGPGTMAGHYDHVHWASDGVITSDGLMVSADGASAGGGFDLGAVVRKMWDDAINKIGKWTGPGLIGEMPGAMMKKMVEAAWDTVKEAVSKFASLFGGQGGQDGVRESWREMAMWAMRREGFNADDPRQVNAMLDQIMSESSGIANRNQEIVDVNGTGASAGQGLLQVIPTTFADHRDPSLPNDRTNPEANMVAALRYYKWRYGTDLTTMWGHGHGYATGGVLPGYTPGRDVHHFFSPTAGSLHLSGGESIMVPEWTRAVGGPAAVERMNRAARAGRATTGGEGFADGGVYGTGERFWKPIGDRQRTVAAELNMNLRRLADELVKTRDWNGFTAGVDRAVQPALRELEKIANPHTYEGIAARSAAVEVGDIFGSLGMESIDTVTTALITAEKELLDSRAQHVARLDDVKEKEKALEEAREKAATLKKESPELSIKDQRRLEDAEAALAKARKESDSVTNSTAKNEKDKAKAEEKRAKAKENADEKVADAEKKLARVREDIGIKEGETAEKRAEDIKNADEAVTKAEKDLAEARKKTVEELDMLIYDVEPGIYHGLKNAISQVQNAAKQAIEALPQAANAVNAIKNPVIGALEHLAAVAGPAGMSVGELVRGIKTFIKATKAILETIDKLVQNTITAQAAAWNAISETFVGMRDWAAMVRGFRHEVAQLTLDQAKAQMDLAAAHRNVRIVAMNGIKAQLQGFATLAEAQTSFTASLKADMKAARGNYDGLSLAFDRFRHNAFTTFDDTMNAQIMWSDKTWELWWGLQASRTDMLLLEKQAQLDLLDAQHKAVLAGLDLVQVTNSLGIAAKKLAIASGKTFGMDETEATVGERWASLQAEKAQLNANSASFKTWLNPVNWFTSMPANTRRIKQIDQELEALQKREEFTLDQSVVKEANRLVSKAGAMGFFGAGANVEMMVQNSVLGDSARALNSMKFENELLDIKAKQYDYEDKINRSEAELRHRRAVTPVELQKQALEQQQGAEQTWSQYYKSDDAELREALAKLANYQEMSAKEFREMAANPEQVVYMDPTKTAYSAEEVSRTLGELGVRVNKLENPPVRGATVSMSRR